MTDKELWKLEGFDTYEAWLANEKACVKRGKESVPAHLEAAQSIFDDPGCLAILGDAVKGFDSDRQ